MSRLPLCRWSEIAEARQFNEAALLGRPLTKASHLHLSDLIAKILPASNAPGEPPVRGAGQDAGRLLPHRGKSRRRLDQRRTVVTIDGGLR